MDTSYTVPTANIVCIGITLLISFGVPVFLLIWYRVKKKADVAAFFLGCAVFVVFAMILESQLHNIVIGRDNAVSKALNANIWLYALYGGLAAGVFEETGRYVAFRFLLKNRLRKENALMYGAGHGGIEAMLITGMTMINNLVLALAVNSGQAQTMLSAAQQAGAAQQLEDGIRQLSTAAPVMLLMGGVERIIAITLHIALSVIVYAAVTQKGRAWLFPAAVGLHALVDFSAVVLANRISVYIVEAVVAVLTLAVGAFAWKLYHDMHEEVPAVNDGTGDGIGAVPGIAEADQNEAVPGSAEVDQNEAVPGSAEADQNEAVPGSSEVDQNEAVPVTAEAGQNEAAQNGPDAESEEK